MRKCLLSMVAFAMLAACGTSPEPDYFDLTPENGTVLPDVKLVVEIRRPSFPEFLDRPDLVAQGDNDRVRIDENSRWAEPLDRMFERILTEDLRQRLPATTIMAEDDGLFTIPRVTVMTSVDEFNRINGGQVSLQASITVQDKNAHQQPALRHVAYATNAGTSTSDVPESLSVLTGKLADAIAPILHDQAMMGEAAKPPAEPDFQN